MCRRKVIKSETVMCLTTVPNGGGLPLSYSRKLVHGPGRMTCERAAPNPAVIDLSLRVHARARTRVSVNICEHSIF